MLNLANEFAYYKKKPKVSSDYFISIQEIVFSTAA